MNKDSILNEEKDQLANQLMYMEARLRKSNEQLKRTRARLSSAKVKVFKLSAMVKHQRMVILSLRDVK